MTAVAERVGVQPPSLYKRVRDRRELMSLVVAASIDDLSARMEAQRQSDPRERLIALAGVIRSFAHERPVGYALVFGTHSAPGPDAGAMQRSVTPLLDAVAEITGKEHALDGARLLTAWAPPRSLMPTGRLVHVADGNIPRAIPILDLNVNSTV